jgi:hypothetical protein
MRYGSNTSYASVFRDAMSVASASYDTSFTKSVPTNPWKTRPPLDISYVPTDVAFPPLPAQKPVPATASTTSETFDEDTFQSAISSAIKKLEERHQAEMAQLKSDFNAKLEAVELQMKELGKQIVHQTYQALVHEESPLATKIDHEILRQDVTVIKMQLKTLIQLAQKSTGGSSAEVSQPSMTHTPPKLDDANTKRTRMTKSPIPMQSLEEIYTQEILGTSAASIPEEDMEGCEE